MKCFIKRSALLFAATIVIFLTGCAGSGLGVENYMRPPAPAGDSAEIQQLLNEALGSEFTLRYPRSGEHRSAVVLANIDSDVVEETIVFYRLSTESTGAHMIVLDCTEHNEWLIVGQNIGSGEIDRVMFGDVNGDGSDDIITGWSGVSDGRTINVHSLESGVLHRIRVVSGEEDVYPADQYSEMAVGDFDNDLRDEIMTVYRSPSEGTALARIIRLGYGVDGSAQLRTVGSVATDGSVYQYINAQAGYISPDRFCLVLDGCRGTDHYVTEIIYWNSEEETLVSLFNNGESETAVFARSLATISQDINDDAIIEIPSDKLLPGYSSRSESPMYLTSWYNVDSDEAQLVMRAIMRADQGYYFQFPDEWDEIVTVQPDINSAIMYFYLAESGEDSFTNELFRIKIFTLDEWDNRKEILADTLLQSGEEAPDYQMLETTDYYVYAVLISPQSEEFGINYELITECFHLTS